MSLVATESQYKILERINPLQTTLIERSIVSSRVALLLRSAEIKLLFCRFVRMNISSPPLHNCTPPTTTSFILFFSVAFFFILFSLDFAGCLEPWVMTWFQLLWTNFLFLKGLVLGVGTLEKAKVGTLGNRAMKSVFNCCLSNYGISTLLRQERRDMKEEGFQ